MWRDSVCVCVVCGVCGVCGVYGVVCVCVCVCVCVFMRVAANSYLELWEEADECAHFWYTKSYSRGNN